MAKSIRSKVKKRMRSVKRGVVKQELKNGDSKLGSRRVIVNEKLVEASSGYIRPGWPTVLPACIPLSYTSPLLAHSDAVEERVPLR